MKSSVLWSLWNATTESLWGASPERYLRVRYEDVVRDPGTALAPVIGLLGLPADGVPVGHDATVEIGLCHTVAGNPMRTAAGPVRLVPDDEWVAEMSTPNRLRVVALTAPLLVHYGYRMRAPRRTLTGGGRVFIEDLSGLPRFVARARRNLRWIRDEGPGRVFEEKEIAPVRNTVAAARKWNYRRHDLVPRGTAVPVFVVGLQRSGTNMLVRGLGAAPETEVHNENDARAFDRFKLKPMPVVRSIVTSSRHSHVLFKPLCDSHRVDHLLDDLHTASAGRAVWAYRDVEGRVRSALARFGDGNLQVLREFADNTNTTRWHVQRISPETAAFVRSFDYSTMTPASGAALMWFVRNQLYFDLRLHERSDVLLVSYQQLLAHPAATMTRLCAFLGFRYRDQLVGHIAGRRPTYREPLDIEPRILERCSALGEQLDAVARAAAGGSAAGR